ncbi:MAG: thiamine biosynthesis lipoprotein [Granulosicoccus sp.]|jgi:thiamine biosynthesis lipoprotein
MKYILTLSTIILTLVSCDTKPEMQVSSGYTQGTSYTVKYRGVSRDLSYQIDSTLLVFDRHLSTYISSSYISKWNRGEAVGGQPADFKTVVKRGMEIHTQTNGAFDLTIGPLFSLWKMDGEGNVPDSTQVDSVLQFVGSGKLSIDDSGNILRSNFGLQLDVNAIAQGFAVDVLSDLLERYRASDYLVEIGGEIRVKGLNANGEPWRLAIDSPNEENLERGSAIQFSLSDGALATSGNYRHYIEAGGMQYGHIIDPRTGWSASSDVLSASVIAPDCMTADALATAIMVEGAKFGINLIENSPDLEGVIITGKDGITENWVSEGVK